MNDYWPHTVSFPVLAEVLIGPTNCYTAALDRQLDCTTHTHSLNRCRKLFNHAKIRNQPTRKETVRTLDKEKNPVRVADPAKFKTEAEIRTRQIAKELTIKQREASLPFPQSAKAERQSVFKEFDKD